MAFMQPKPEKSLAALVAALPEVYQPILGHPEYDGNVRRTSIERLERMLPVVAELAKKRPLRVLDIGCAQGYFSLSLAKRGLVSEVVGIDSDPASVELCALLAGELGVNGRFVQGKVTPELLAELGGFDVVLGLNIFHHVAHFDGLDRALMLLKMLAQSSGLVFLELALKEEGLYWAQALPEDYRDFLAPFPFWHKLGVFRTHLTSIVRPLVVASSRYAVVDNQVLPFDEVLTSSHEFERGVHLGTRRYFLSNEAGLITKRYEKGARGALNRAELLAEKEVLERHAGRVSFVPRLLAFEETDEVLLLSRTAHRGKRLSQLIVEDAPYDADQAVTTVLDQLVELEQHGLFHNDLRTWNVLYDAAEKRWTLIDFGVISQRQIEPVFDRFLALCYAILTREKPVCEFAFWPRHNPRQFPERYRPMVEQLTRCPPEALSFAKLRDWLQGKDLPPAAGNELESLDRKVTHLHGTLEHAFNALVPSLVKGMPEVREAIGWQNRSIAALEAGLASSRQQAQERLESHDAQLASIRELVQQLQQVTAQQAAAQQSLAERNEVLARQLEADRAEAEALRRELGEARQHAAGTEQRLEETRQRLEGTSQALEGTRQSLEGTRQELEGTRQSLAETRQQAAELRQGLTEARQVLDGVRGDVALLRDQVAVYVDIKRRLKLFKPLYLKAKAKGLL
jgi:O-antigen chain-terminating methyltransferase